MATIKEIAQLVEQETGIKTLPRHIERILEALLATGDFWQVSGNAHLPVPVVASAIKHMQDAGWVNVSDDKIELTADGLRVAQEAGLSALPSYKCPRCGGRGIDYTARPDWWNQFKEIIQERPEPIQQYDQAYVTPETTISRVLMLEERGDLRNRRILVMGAEDDLTGLAVALTGLAKEVLILDIDERLINFDNHWIQKLNLPNARAQVFDLRKPFPEEWLRHFDVFITDPPETLMAFKAFIGRGVAALKGAGSAGYFGLTLQDSSMARWQQLQRMLLDEWDMVITDIKQDFNEYVPWPYHQETKAQRLAPVKVGPSDIWYRSAWYRVELLSDGKGINEAFDEGVLKELYLDEESSTT